MVIWVLYLQTNLKQQQYIITEPWQSTVDTVCNYISIWANEIIWNPISREHDFLAIAYVYFTNRMHFYTCVLC